MGVLQGCHLQVRMHQERLVFAFLRPHIEQRYGPSRRLSPSPLFLCLTLIIPSVVMKQGGQNSPIFTVAGDIIFRANGWLPQEKKSNEVRLTASFFFVTMFHSRTKLISSFLQAYLFVCATETYFIEEY